MPGRRHYSWPFSGSSSSAKAEELRYNPRKVDSLLSTSRIKGGSTSLFAPFDQTFGPSLSLYSSSDEEEMMSSAGILDIKSEKHQLRRQRRERRAEHKRRRRERRQSHKSVGNSNGMETNNNDDGAEEIIISSITQASEAPVAIMRRLVWPHLERVRQFFIPLQTIRYLTGSWTLHSKYGRPTEKKNREIKTRYVAKLTSPSAPSLSGARRSSADETVLSLSIPDKNEWMLRPGRRHRRCHSEQPRAWREPNPGLWTLAEE
ncbi:hypothetical protein TMatcc_004941 [Talaromyces marneffei ATCC 18224]|uniref:Uncharacterized protein n=1 Tax=Talaromyces marneffei PM1 TaxID=1077442 RepID=A0A093XB27_TALMA|nr:hypothetical protein EYB25_002194 [Talaromyces marneffei]